MDLPSFSLLWRSSEQLDELECVLEQIDRAATHKKIRSRKRSKKHREGLYGVAFEAEDRDYYEPIKYCCDESFYTEPEYREHVANHKLCPVDGCQFVGHGKMLRIHSELVHANGFCDLRGTCDKSILEWREARKRNFPTLERAEAKRELLTQRLTRGQVFKTAEFGGIKRTRPPIISERDICSSPPRPEQSSLAEDTSPILTIHRASSDCVDNSKFFECTPPGSPQPSALAPTTAAKQIHSSTSLVAQDYGDSSSSSSSDNSCDESILPATTALPAVNPTTVSSCSKPSRGRRQRGGRRRTAKRTQQLREFDDFYTPLPPGEKDPFLSHPVVQMALKRRSLSRNPDRIHSRPSLLHMLLASDMRTERNQLMQCIRFVIKNNWLTTEQSPTTHEEKCNKT